MLTSGLTGTGVAEMIALVEINKIQTPFLYHRVLKSGQVETAKIHHLVPCSYKVVYKLFF
jgi:hypothetical protein